MGTVTKDHKLLLRSGVVIFVLLALAYTIQGVRSAYRLYPSHLGYQVRAFDVTPRWVGTKNLLSSGVDPYSEQGCALIEEAFFGRSLGPEDEGRVKDRQHFAYPLHVIFLYAPTVIMDFPDALLLLWMAGFVMFIVSLVLWSRMAGLENRSYAFLLIPFFLSWPQVYIGLQARQPLFFVFFFISLGTYLSVHSEKKISHWIAGVLLFLSTVKPQNSVIPVAYLLLLWLPSMGDNDRTRSVWLGFLSMMGVSLIVTLVLVPGWPGEFVQALLRYRNYAGTTGAESVWGGGRLATAASLFFVIGAFVMGLMSYRLKESSLHLWVFSYGLMLQCLIFPAHLYVFVMGIPLVLVIFKHSLAALATQRRCGPYLHLGIISLAIYITYSYWLNILAEAGLPDGLATVVQGITERVPRFRLYAPIPLILVSGVILFLDRIREGARIVHPKIMGEPQG
jgi:hypothetical protein